METYPADEVDRLLGNMWSLADECLKEATRFSEEASTLRAEKVLLEKVASAPKAALDPKKVDEALESLQDLAIITDDKGREKIAAAIALDPNYALELMLKVATLSLPAPDSGAGLSKSASRRDASAGSESQDSDPDGWRKLIEEGA